MKKIRNIFILVFAIMILIPFINVKADGESRVQIINNISYNGLGTFTISGGTHDGTESHSSTMNELFAVGTQITLTATPGDRYIFVGWYNCHEVDISGGHGVMGWEAAGEALSTNTTYTFNATSSFYNIMPVFKTGHNNIWVVGDGKIAVNYANSEREWQNGEDFREGDMIDYVIGDSVTVIAQANPGSHFVGWYITDPDASVPENYVREPVVSTSASYTYQPGITTISGYDAPINYLTAVFAENTARTTAVVDEFRATSFETEEVPANTDLASYVNRKKWNLDNNNATINNQWLTLFGETNGVYKYPKEGAVTYVFIEQTFENSGTSNVKIINHYRVEYTEVTVTKMREPLQFQVWHNDGGATAIQYTIDEPNPHNLASRTELDFEPAVGTIYYGIEATVTARPDPGYVFVGWYHVDIDYEVGSADHPLPYMGEVISTDLTYTYKPGVTVLPGDEEELRYVCAVFEKDEVKSADLLLNVPKVGDTVTIEGDDWDTQRPQLEIILPSDARYELDGGEEYNYMYYTGTDVSVPFSGTFESGKTYNLLIWLRTKDEILFSEGATVLINGTEATITDYDGDLIEVKYEFTPREFDYEIISGANQTYPKNSNKDLTVKSNGELGKLTRIRVDGQDITEYETANGSTILTLKASYLDTLSIGEHKLTFVYNDGYVDTTFKIIESENPKTNDNIIIYIAMLTFSLFGILGTYIYRKNY